MTNIKNITLLTIFAIALFGCKVWNGTEDGSTTTQPTPTSSPTPMPETTSTPTPTPTPTVSSGPKVIFISIAAFSGGMAGTATGAIAAADHICNTAISIPYFPSPHNSGTYKAMLAANGVRTASPALDWVLAPSMQYIRADGTTVIGTTTAAAVFSFPMTNTVEPVDGMMQKRVYSGLNSDWTIAASNCSDWTVNTGNTVSAWVDQTDSKFLYDDSTLLSCGVFSSYNILCVEQ